MDMASRIKERRISMGYTQEELADKLGLQKSAIAKYENGRVTNIKRSTIAKMAIVLDCSPSYLMGFEDVQGESVINYSDILPIKKQKIRLMGEIACGKPIYASEDYETYVLADKDIKADFALKAKGDSMINARINDGDIVFIREQPQVENGEIAAVIIGDEATLKRVYYYKESNKLVLQAENPKYEPFVYVGKELEEVKILGKAVAFLSEIK